MAKPNTAAEKAINAAGGAARLAEKLLIPDADAAEKLKMASRIGKWKVNGIPPKWVLRVESASGVSRHELAPHIYPVESAAA